ncbi:MAG TPA: tetratricopeptide repeat protein, partial [Candidatus Manganitrophaceae bacterium]
SATTAYRKSLQENPQNAPLLNNLANLYLVQKTDLEEAESLARRAIEIDPSRKAYYLDTLGSIYIEREDYDLALSVFREAEILAGPDGALIEAIRKNQARLVDLLGLRNGQNDGS